MLSLHCVMRCVTLQRQVAVSRLGPTKSEASRACAVSNRNQLPAAQCRRGAQHQAADRL